MKISIENINSIKTNRINSFYTKINSIKVNKINKLRIINKKKQSIVGELLLKDLIEKNYDIKYKDLIFKYNEYGKPFIQNYNIHFNISHSYDYVVAVISNNKIGIDIEKIRKTNLNNIYQFATYNEIEYILSSNNNIEKKLFTIYTLKESYFKMKGTNLNNIKNIEFTINNNIISCSDNSVNLTIITDIDNYIIAICEEKEK